MKAKCPICACEINETPITCNRCGVKYHVDCWSYNKGCAIYGCVPVIAPPKPVTAIRGERESTFWLRNAAVFAVALLPPSGVGIYLAPSWYVFFKLPSSFELLTLTVVVFLATFLAGVLEKYSARGDDGFVVGRIFVSTIVMYWAPVLWLALVLLCLMAGIMELHRYRHLLSLSKKLSCKG